MNEMKKRIGDPNILPSTNLFTTFIKKKEIIN